MTTTLHGVPLNEWVGRMMKSSHKNRVSGKARHTVKVISLNPDTKEAVVHPSGHRNTEITPFRHLLPWWSRNDDLRKKYGVDRLEMESILGASEAIQQGHRIGKNQAGETCEAAPARNPVLESVSAWPRSDAGKAMISQEEGSITAGSPETPALFKELPPRTIQMNPNQKLNVIPPGPQAPQEPLRTIRRIIVDPNASLTWMEDYKALQDALQGVKDEEHRLEMAKQAVAIAHEMVNTFVAALDGVGVQIEWDEPAPESEPEVSAITGLSELDTARVKVFRNALIRQMNPGRQYDREGIMAILGEPENATTKKILTHAFRDHPKLVFKRGGGGAPGIYSIKP